MDKPADSASGAGESINAYLCKLSDSFSAFQRCVGELHRHIDSVRTSIDSSILLLLPPPPTNTAPPAAPEASEAEAEAEAEAKAEAEVEDEQQLISPARSKQKSSRLELKSSPRSERKSAISEIESLCQTMNSNSLRNYMIRRISCTSTLRKNVPKALKLSPNPAKLILESIGNFYTQGRNAYVEGSPLINKRQALVLLLECFIKTGEGGEGGVEIDNGVKEDAEQAALAWYKRLNLEGGIRQTQEIDARGLLLFIGCFGIPQAFTNEDSKNLMHQSYIKMISGSLRRSSVLMAKIPDIIEEMLKQNKVVDAVYFTFIFGLEGKFNPKRLLTSFLRESKLTLLDKIKSLEQMEGSKDLVLTRIIGVKRRYLGGLKSVIQCLGRNKIDHSKFLPEWELDKKVISLERELAQLRKKRRGDQKMVRKRKINETERLSNKEVKHSHFPNPRPPQQQRVVNHVDRNNTLLEGGRIAGHIYGHSVYPWVLHGPVAGSIHENVIGSLAGPVGGVAMAVPGAGISANVDGIHSGVSAGIDVRSRVDGSHGDATVYDKLPTHRYAYRPSSYLEGPNAHSRPPPYMENSAGLPNTKPGDVNRPPPYLQSSAGLPNTITGDAYRPPPYLGGSTGLSNTNPGEVNKPPSDFQGSAGLPSTITGDVYRHPPHMGGSNTIPPPYQLANTGPATELYWSSGSRAVDTAPSAALAHPSSSLYWQR